jgi:hypothetical protein
MRVNGPYETPADRLAEQEAEDRGDDHSPAERRLRIVHLAHLAGGEVIS